MNDEEKAKSKSRPNPANIIKLVSMSTFFSPSQSNIYSVDKLSGPSHYSFVMPLGLTAFSYCLVR